MIITELLRRFSGLGLMDEYLADVLFTDFCEITPPSLKAPVYILWKYFIALGERRSRDPSDRSVIAEYSTS